MNTPNSLTLRFSQYTAASKSSTLDPTAKALASLGNLVAKDPKLAAILNAPSLSPEDKTAIVAELSKQSGASTPTVKNFLDTLAENNRLGLLGGVCEKFSEIIAAARGEVEMKVTSAQVRLSLPPFDAFSAVSTGILHWSIGSEQLSQCLLQIWNSC